VILDQTRQDRDALLDRYMPNYDFVERRCIRVSAPADVTLATAREMDLRQSRIVRAILRGRELILGSRPAPEMIPTGIIAQTTAIGWQVLAEVPGREIVMGAITQPWAADVVFRPVPPELFAAHSEPGYVKIAWTLRVDPLSPESSVFRTETRVVACDDAARARFQRYWRFFRPGIVLIRLVMLPIVKREAERRARSSRMVAPALSEQRPHGPRS
jgi:hypothetical protein